MRPEPRQFDSEADLYTAAVGALARRAHSSFEMRKYLERRAASVELVAKVMDRLRERGLIDDQHYAASFARARAAHRRQGPLRIARELRARGVADRHIEAALETVSSPESDGAALRRRIDIWLRHHKNADGRSLDRNQQASLYRSLLRAGFAGDRIRAELGRMRSGAGAPEENEAELG